MSRSTFLLFFLYSISASADGLNPQQYNYAVPVNGYKPGVSTSVCYDESDTYHAGSYYEVGYSHTGLDESRSHVDKLGSYSTKCNRYANAIILLWHKRQVGQISCPSDDFTKRYDGDTPQAVPSNYDTDDGYSGADAFHVPNPDGSDYANFYVLYSHPAEIHIDRFPEVHGDPGVTCGQLISALQRSPTHKLYLDVNPLEKDVKEIDTTNSFHGTLAH